MPIPGIKIEEIITIGDRKIDESMQGFDLWWIEYGGMFDTIKDNEEIKYELLKIVYGVWDYIKNSGKFNAETLALNWVGSLPGKRESRRFIGDNILTQNDLSRQTDFEDAVCYGGWSIDTHPEEGIYSKMPSSSHQWVNPYNIPFRCLYSRNVPNLMFAGRNISATHIAFASTRIMNTCSVIGQAAGTAAAVAARNGITPREAALTHIGEIQQALLKADGYFMGGKNADPLDKARSAIVRASGSRPFEAVDRSHPFPLDREVTFILPALQKVDSLALLVQADQDTQLEVEVYLSGKPQNFKPENKLTEFSIPVPKTTGKWVALNLYLDQNDRNIVCVIKRNDCIKLWCSDNKCTGTGAWYGRESNRPFDFYPCFRLCGSIESIYHPDNILNGYCRIYGLPNLWVSKSLHNGVQWIELDFGKEMDIYEILLFFNPDLNREFFNLRPTYYNQGLDRMPEELVKSYRILAVCDHSETELVSIRDNWKRLAQHTFTGIKASALRIEITETWGGQYAEIFEVRVY